jgi:hypothetical protein
MKLRGFRPHEVVPGVEIWENDAFDVPLRRVLAAHLVSVEPEQLLGTSDLTDSDLIPDPPMGQRQGPVGFRTPEGVERRFEMGMVAGFSFSGMLDFLTTRYVPLADGPFEQLCRRAAADKLTVEVFRREVEKLLVQLQAGHDEPFSMTHRFRHRDSWSGSPILFAGVEEMLPGLRVETSSGPGIFMTEEFQVLSREFVASCRGLAVPRRAWALLSKFPTEPVLYWDGERAGSVPKHDRLPAGFLAAMDAEGTSLADLPSPCVGAPELEPRFVLRVPSKAELLAATEKAPRDPALRCAALLFDSRAAVALPAAGSAAPVIDDPGIARYVLCRTSPLGTYVPTASPSAVPLGGHAGTVMIGTLPGLP